MLGFHVKHESINMDQLWTVCHPENSGMIQSQCQQRDDQAINFNGDDRVILFQDINGDGAFTMGQDLILGWISKLGRVPEGQP